MEDWTKWLDSSVCIETIFLDFQKAFDSESHKRLLSKLVAYGILRKISNCVQHFLINRCQRIIVENRKS